MFRQVLNTIIIKVVAGIINLAITVLIARYLGAAGKGLQSILFTTVSFIVIVYGMIGSGGLTFLIPRYKIHTLLFPIFIWFLIISVGSWFLLIRINSVPNDYVIHVVILAFINGLTTVNNSILQAKKKIQQINYVTLVQVVTLILFLLVFYVLLNKASIELYILSLYFSFGLSFILSFIFASRFYVMIPFKITFPGLFYVIKKHFYHGSFNQVDILAQIFNFRFAYYVITLYLTNVEVGVYATGVALIESIWIIARSLGVVQHSRIVNWKDSVSSIELTNYFSSLSFLFTFFALALLLLFPSSVYIYLFGNEFAEVKTVLFSLAPGVLFFSISFILSSFFSGTGKHYINTYASIAGLLVTVSFIYILIPQFGIVGAGITASLSYTVTTIVKAIYFKKISAFNIFRLMFPGKEMFSLRGWTQIFHD